MASVILALEYGVRKQDSNSFESLIITITKVDYLDASTERSRHSLSFEVFAAKNLFLTKKNT